MMRYAWLLVAISVSAAACGEGAGTGEGETVPDRSESPVVKIATFNVEQLSADKVDSLDAGGRGAHPQLLAAAEIIQRARPDVLVLNEVDLARTVEGALDRDDLGAVVRRFQEHYLAVGDDSIRYRHVFVAPSNTGLLSGVDLNQDGTVAGPEDVGTREHGDDSFGYGEYPGQYAMALLSRYPVDTASARTFQEFLWKDLPGHHMPTEFYSDTARSILRLSSKSHWDVPIEVDGRTIHLWVSHPTPPVFDGPENRNGRRNFDEVGFWARYLEGSDAIYDDQGRRGGYRAGEPFVIAGDLNADPAGGEAQLGDTAAISQLLGHPRIQDPEPLRGTATAAFGGGMRVDYVLPSAGLEVVDAGVFGPEPGEPAGEDETRDRGDPGGEAVGGAEGAEEASLAGERDAVEGAPPPALAKHASDHRLVWVEVRAGG